ncbi:MAG: hypothetical protein AAF828_01085 [Bacteroidota bacterium]
MKYASLFLVFGLLLACDGPQKEVATASLSGTNVNAKVTSRFSGELDPYWYQGKAELNTYELQQSRYGEVHPGVATLIFVSEDFLTDKQVKNDRYSNPNSAPILKTNQIRRFTTGIYDYSVMTSVFTPTQVDKFPHTLKVTNSSQDWCGQTFAQLNYQGGDNWQAQLRSYFESEGDLSDNVKGDWLEDEIFNRLRIDPNGLPIGAQQAIPSMQYFRFTHKPFATFAATTSLAEYAGEDFTGANLKEYSIVYPSINRTVKIVFEAAVPYKIVGWTESYPSRGRQLTTKATLKKSILAPYWEQNSNRYADEHTNLGLSDFAE